MDFEKIIKGNLEEMQGMLEAFVADPQSVRRIDKAARMMVDCFKAGGKLIACGNGGSMSDSMHLCEELSGHFREDRPSLPAVAISDPAYLTCAANDYGYERVFSRFVEGMGRSGDILVAISTSGRSANVIAAAREARSRGMRIITLTGLAGTPLGELSDVDICTPASPWADRVQELHIKVIHTLIQLVEVGMGYVNN